jgi:hypothetical protein
MDYFNSAADSIKGAVPGTGASSWGNMFSSNPTPTPAPAPKTEEEQDATSPGSATQTVQPTVGGRRIRRRKQCGGSFHPYTEHSNSASTASVFKGGRKRRTRKSYKKNKKSRRKSHTKRR